MFLFLIILILLGALMEILSLRRDPSLLEMDYSISTDAAEPGKPFAVQTVLTNKSRIPVSYLAVREYYPEYAVVPDGVTTQAARTGLLVRNICRMKSRRRKKLALEVSISKRGVHIFTADSIEFGDFLGFRVISKKIALQREIVIYPEALENPGLSQALSSFCGDIAARRFLIRDPILTAGAREYTAREPMKEIHWPQTAKRGCLMVREFEYSRQPSACVILNVEGAGPEESDMDKLCSVTRAVCQALINTGASVSFFTNAQLKRKERWGVWKCEASPLYMGMLLEGLGRATSTAAATADRLLRQALRESDPDAAFIAVMPEYDTSGTQLIETLRQKTGREILLING
ncbi:MAG: DUF58 domain-containing protein [Clostridiales bacterium]|jgi:uncharacterized protein (DUF58 family)|nr:DUF58 domain-containing protein [Clostridiales bacterium]